MDREVQAEPTTGMATTRENRVAVEFRAVDLAHRDTVVEKGEAAENSRCGRTRLPRCVISYPLR